ncbi:MAG: response regulator [Lentisphaeraceae bacterium]|nr:response regulator [Lentisphaeraceae bacterium]
MSRKYNILVVDDTIKNLQLLCCILQEVPGYMVNVARNGLEALEMVQKVDFDIILLDIQMPEMDGYEACQRLKSDERFAYIPIIFLTAQTEQESIIKAFECGAADYLVKPFCGQELTMRVKNQIELKDHREHLEKLVEERTEELAGALNEVRRTSRIKDEFLSTMSHEMRTPMNGILGLSTLLASDDLTSEQAEYVGKIQSSMSHLQGIIENMFEYTLIQSGETLTEFEPTDINELLGEVSVSYEKLAKVKGIDFRLDISEDVPASVNIDSRKVKSILCQLLENSVKFTEAGYVSLDVNSTCENGRLVIELNIRDSGIGIPEDRFDLIFEKFTQVDSSSTRDYEGVGIGLAICKDLVEAVNGSISLDSQLGQGSCFTVKIPLLQLVSK